jgi:hypothetical protein
VRRDSELRAGISWAALIIIVSNAAMRTPLPSWVNRVILIYAPIISVLHQQADNRRARHHVSKVPQGDIQMA